MSHNKGFTLVELSIAFIIIVLLLAGAMIPLSTQIELRGVADTQRSMDQIREAIIGFAQANGRLPCPAVGTIVAGTPTAGTEQCPSTSGVVPWATLGVPETDSWGRRFSYRVSPIFTDAVGTTFESPGQSPSCATPTPTPTQSSFALCSLGVLGVDTRRESDHVATPLGLQLPAVIISHGKNGFGAFTPRGVALVAPAGADEIANASAVATTFVSRSQTPSASPCNDTAAGSFCEFDDIVVMITSNVLIARMVAAGRLP